jgi:hypothetical protein
VTLRDISICTKLWFECKTVKIEICVFERLLVLNDFGVVSVLFMEGKW